MTDFNTPYAQFLDGDENALKWLLSQQPEKHKKIFEIGAWTGHSTSILAAHALEYRGHVVTIDTFDGGGSKLGNFPGYNPEMVLHDNLTELGLRGMVTVLKGENENFCEMVEIDTIDFMFIDGDHRYKGIKKDIELWWPKMKKGGIFCGHDFDSYEYDEKHINEDCTDRHNGVIKAVLEKFPTVNKMSTVWWIEKY